MSSKPKESDEAFDARWKAYFERQVLLTVVAVIADHSQSALAYKIL